MAKIYVATTLKKNPISYFLQMGSLFFPNGFYYNLDIEKLPPEICLFYLEQLLQSFLKTLVILREIRGLPFEPAILAFFSVSLANSKELECMCPS